MRKKNPKKETGVPQTCEDVRTGLSTESIKRAILENLNFIQGRIPILATPNDWYMSLAYTVRDRMLERWIRSILALRQSPRAVCYLSAEFSWDRIW